MRGFLTAALACAISAGLVMVTATVLLVDALRGGADPENLTLRLYLLFSGTVAGILIAAWAAWHLLGPISSSYRRGGLAMVSGFATVLLMLVCIPINQVLGRTGLIMLLGLSGVTAALLARQVKRLGPGM
ncbi:MAG: hypothetical protein H0T58_07315 [Gemmatimonadales bacterium]|nr:hypothetical protein [Gemmatimonadales bacterium]